MTRKVQLRWETMSEEVKGEKKKKGKRKMKRKLQLRWERMPEEEKGRRKRKGRGK